MRPLIITVFVFLYSTTGFSFESDLLPVELNHILVTRDDILLLHKEPNANSPVTNNYQIKKGASISFDKSRTRTLKSGKVLVQTEEVYLQGKSYGNIDYLSKKQYDASFSAPRGPWEGLVEGFHFKKGDILEELHHAPEGSCVVKYQNDVMWIEACLWYGKTADYKRIEKPESEWWIRVTSNKKPQGWLLIKDLSSIELQ